MADRGVTHPQAEPIPVRHGPLLMSVLHLRRAEECAARLSDAFGCRWPLEPGAVSGPAHWLGPRSWALTGIDPAEAESGCARACASVTHHLVHVGEGHRRWVLEDPWGREVLARGCSLDLHPKSFPGGRCARTLLAQIPVLLVRPPAAAEFHLIAEASLSDYAQQWLEDAFAHCALPPS